MMTGGTPIYGTPHIPLILRFSADATAVRQLCRIEVVAAKIALDPHVTHSNALPYPQNFGKNQGICRNLGQAYVNVAIQKEMD